MSSSTAGILAEWWVREGWGRRTELATTSGLVLARRCPATAPGDHDGRARAIRESGTFSHGVIACGVASFSAGFIFCDFSTALRMS